MVVIIKKVEDRNGIQLIFLPCCGYKNFGFHQQVGNKIGYVNAEQEFFVYVCANYSGNNLRNNKTGQKSD